MINDNKQLNSVLDSVIAKLKQANTQVGPSYILFRDVLFYQFVAASEFDIDILRKLYTPLSAVNLQLPSANYRNTLEKLLNHAVDEKRVGVR